MFKIKVIKSQTDYVNALKRVEELIQRDPDPDSEEGEQLNLLSTLIQDYENEIYPSTIPNAIDAIKFRMEQANLTPSDLVPFIGSKSRVSEILSGKRQLTLDMVRALSDGLGIPVKSLVKKADFTEDLKYENWDENLVNEMDKRGYFANLSLKAKNNYELLKEFFSIIGSPSQLVGVLRKSSYRSSPLTDKRALAAWSTFVYRKSKKIKTTKKYQHGIIDLKFMQDIARMSTKDDGPLLAQDYLKKNGIVLVIERHFNKTYLDGATILIDKEKPVIGLTLRYDRLDNYWFTLMHELAHLSKHYNSGISLFYDEIEGIKGIDLNEKEREADGLAEEALLPKAKWDVSPAKLIPSFMAAHSLAKELGVHVSIIAGQIRYKGNKYTYLNKIVNKAKVRKYFFDRT